VRVAELRGEVGDRPVGAGEHRGRHAEIPILGKDNCATRDRMETSAGSLALFGSRVPSVEAWSSSKATTRTLGCRPGRDGWASE
jgi:hypothetical protein